MGLSFDKYKEMQSQNKFFWDTENFNQTAGDIDNYLRGFSGQLNASEEKWGTDEHNEQSRKLNELRAKVDYMRTYANSLKDSDPGRYREISTHVGQLDEGLNSAQNWLKNNSPLAVGPAGYEWAHQRKNQIEENKKKIEELKKAMTIQKAMKEVDDWEKSNSDVTSSSFLWGESVGKSLEPDYEGHQIMLDNTKAKIAKKYGIDINEFSEAFKARDTQKKYDLIDGQTYDGLLRLLNEDKNGKDASGKLLSYRFSNEEKEYIFDKIVELGNASRLEMLKRDLSDGGMYNDNYYTGLKQKVTNQTIEEKNEKKYYLDAKEKNPEIDEILKKALEYDRMIDADSISIGQPGMANVIESHSKAKQKYIDQVSELGVDGKKAFKYYKRFIEHQEAEEENDWWKEAAKNHPFGATVLSIPMNMFGSAGDTFKYGLAEMDKLSGGDGYVDTATTANKKAQIVRDTVNQMISDGIDNDTLKYLAQFGYSVSTSSGDMLLAAAVNSIPIIGTAASSTMFFSAAGVNAANEVLENGGSLDQASMTLITHGAFELIFERVSLKKLRALKASNNINGLKEVAKKVLKQSFAEGREEVFTSIADGFADEIINKDLSRFNRTKRNYILNGKMSEEEADKAARIDFVKDLTNDFLGGAAAGGIFGGGASAIALRHYNNALGSTNVEIEGNVMSAKKAMKLGPDYYMNVAQELNKMPTFDVQNLIDAAKKGDKKAVKLAESIENTMIKKGADAVTTADVSNLLEALHKESIDSIVRGEDSKSADVVDKINVKRAAEFKREYNSRFDETGVESASGVQNSSTKAFGINHKNGVYATDNGGQQIVVTGIESSASEYGQNYNNVILKLDSGKTVNAGEVTFENPDYERLVNLAANYDTLGARALVANFEEAQSRGLNTDRYLEEYELLYKMGRAGVEFESAKNNAEFSGIIQSVGEKIAENALSAGNNDAEMHIRLKDTSLRRVRVPGERTSATSRLFTKSNTVIKAESDFLQIMQTIAEKTGNDIVFTDRLSDGDVGVYADNRIYLNENLDEHTAVAVALHEAVHSAKVYAPVEYRALEKFVMNYLVENNQNVSELLDDIAARWGQDAAGREAQREELIAQTVMALASDENAFMKAVETPQNKKLLEKVREAIKRLAAKVKEFFRGTDENGRGYGHNRQAQPWLDDIQALEKLAGKFDELVTAAKDNKAEYGSRESVAKHSVANASINEFDSGKAKDSDVRYSKDDGFYFNEDDDLSFGESTGALDEIDPYDEFERTYGEIIDDEVEVSKHDKIDINKLIIEHPDDAAFWMYNAAERTTEKGIRKYNGVALGSQDYLKVARRVMNHYEIMRSLNPDFDTEFAQRIEKFVNFLSKNPKASYSSAINGLAQECRQYLLEHSGRLERSKGMEEIAKSVYATLRGATLIITPYAESHVLENFGGIKRLRRMFKGYVNIGFEKDKYRYKRPIYMDDIIDSISDETSDGHSLGEVSPLWNERPDSLSGWTWLSDLLGNTLQPKIENVYNNGMIENVNPVAMEMALDIATEVVAQKANKAAETIKGDRKTIRELKKQSEEAIAKREALHKVKLEKNNREIEKLKRRVEQERGLKELAQQDLDIIKRFVADDTKNYREQYKSQIKARNDLEAIRRQMRKLRTMIMNPTNEKFIPPEILRNGPFLNAIEGLGEAVIGNSRSLAAEKMNDMLRYIRKIRTESEKYDGDFLNTFDKEYINSLQNVADWIKTTTEVDENGNRKRINRQTFSNDELAELRQLVDEIVYRIDTSRKLLLRQDGMTAREAGDKVIAQTREIKNSKARRIFAGFSQELMNPLRAVNLMSNYNKDSELYKLFYALNEGQRKEWFWEMEAERPFVELMEKHDKEYKQACNDIVHYDYFVDGKEYKIDMTRMQALQILMTWKREAGSNMNHMKRGGIVVADPKVVAKGKGAAWEKAQNVPVGADLINQIVKGLNSFENKYLLTAENYFNKVAKNAINEVFMVTRHREVARSDYYIPVRVDSKFSKAEIQSLEFNLTLEGAGSYKHIVPHAPQPILIEALNSVIERHIGQTGKLYGLDIPLINFKKMFKGTTNFAAEGREWFNADSVKKALSDKFGESSVKYIEDTISALEAGRERKESKFSAVAEWLYTKRVQTALVGNFGVVIKQAASYPTAGLYLSAKDLSAGLGKFLIAKKSDGTHFRHAYARTIEEIDKYTAQHYQRRKGMSVQEVAETLHGSKLARKAPTAVNPVKWIQAMDCATTAALWEAAKSHVNSEYKSNGEKIGSEKYWQEVTKLYDTIIEDTQPMYDELHRSDFQKKGSSMKKFVFPFKTQPMQNMGILADVASEFVTKHDKASAKKLAKAVSSQISSNIIFSLMTLAAALLRHKADRYRDDDDKITIESAAPQVLWDMFSNGINAVAPIGGDWVIPAINDIGDSINKRKISTKNLKNATEISLVNDWFTKFTKSANLLNDQLNGTNKAKADAWNVFWKVLDVPGSFSEIFGIPYSNLSLLFKGTYNNLKEQLTDIPMNNYGELKTDNIVRHIFNAYDSGNDSRARKLRELWADQLMSEGKTKEKAVKAINNKLIVAAENTEIAQMAAQAKVEGRLNEHKELVDKLAAKVGDYDIADKAVDQIVNKLKESGKSDGTTQEKSEYSYKDAVNALASGDTVSFDTAKAEIARVMIANEKAESEEEAMEKVGNKLKSFDYTKELFDDYYSVEGDKYFAAKAALEKIYGDGLKKKYEEYVKKYIEKK